MVAGREFSNSPLVIFIPLSGKVSLSAMSRHLDRVKQLAIDISTGEIDIAHLSKPRNVRTENVVDSNVMMTSEETPVSRDDGIRFEQDSTFNKDKCLQLHQQVLEVQVRYEMDVTETNRKRARTEEIRLGLVPDAPQQTEDIRPESPIPEAAARSPEPSADSCDYADNLVDIHTSTMFVFAEGSTLSYFQAAPGLAAPHYCPEDSDDEKPLDVIQQEQRQLERKRKAGEDWYIVSDFGIDILTILVMG